MGLRFMDRFSYLHFCVGVIFYYWNISLFSFTIIHLLFEFIENTSYGIYFIDKYFKLWPGGKLFSDSTINIIGDIIFGILGWVSGYILNNKK